MLRSVFVIGLMTACHPAPAPTVVHVTPTAVAAPTAGAPTRQDFEILAPIPSGPLREVLATGHECRQERRQPTGPIDQHSPQPAPRDPPPLQITATPNGCRSQFANGYLVPANYR